MELVYQLLGFLHFLNDFFSKIHKTIKPCILGDGSFETDFSYTFDL